MWAFRDASVDVYAHPWANREVRRAWLFPVTAAFACGTDRIWIAMPADVTDFAAAVLVLSEGSHAKAVGFDPTLESRLSVDAEELDRDALSVSLALFDSPLEHLGLHAGPLLPASGPTPCELAEPRKRYQTTPGTTTLQLSGPPQEGSPELLFFADPQVTCVRLSCRFEEPQILRLPHTGFIGRIQAIDTTHVLLVGAYTGAIILDLETAETETIAAGLIDAVVFDDELYGLGADRSIRRGPLRGPSVEVVPAHPPPGPLSTGLLAVTESDSGPAIFTLMSWGFEDGLKVAVESHLQGTSQGLLESNQWRGGPGRVELVARGPMSLIGVTGGESFVEIENGVSSPKLTSPPIELDGNRARTYGVAFRAPDTTFVGTQGGAIWKTDEAQDWVNLRNRLRGDGIDALALTDDGVFFVDEGGNHGFVHAEFGECWSGRAESLGANSAITLADRVIAAGQYGETGIVQIFKRVSD